MAREIDLNYRSNLRLLGDGDVLRSDDSTVASKKTLHEASTQAQTVSGNHTSSSSVIECLPMNMITLHDMHILRQRSETPQLSSLSSSSLSSSEDIIEQAASNAPLSEAESPPPRSPEEMAALFPSLNAASGIENSKAFNPVNGSSTAQDRRLRNGAVFNDHQDRHAEVLGEKLRWTVTLLVGSSGSPTGFFQWNARSRGDTELHGVIPYSQVGSAVLFPSTAWHRSVIPSESLWPFEAMKFSFFYVAKTGRSRRYESRYKYGPI